MRTLHGAFLAIILAASCAATAGPKPMFGKDIEAFCLEHICRQNVPINLRTGADTPFSGILEVYWPAVQGKQISILAGEKLFIEFEVKGRRIRSLKQVPAITRPESTVEFEFKQMDESTDMMLIVRNPFPDTLRYHINMADPQQKLHHTSSCPVRPGMAVYEHWPHPIIELIISDFRLLKPTDDMMCEY